MSEQQEESEDRSYIREGDVVLVDRDSSNTICRVISKSTTKANTLYVRYVMEGICGFDTTINKISLLIPNENLPLKYKLEDDTFMAYKYGQLLMSIPCTTQREYYQTKHYIQYLSDIYVLRHLKETCKDEKVLKLLKSVNYKYE